MSATASASAPVEPVECIGEASRAGVLLAPLRVEILERLRGEPRSASAVADEMGLPRQRVNYHVKALARARFLRKAGRVRRRNFYEQRYRASARSYLIAPDVLGPVAAGLRSPEDQAGAAYLLAGTARLQSEVGRAAAQAAEEGKRLATLTLEADLRFESAAQRSRFTRALRDAVAGVIAEHAAPAELEDGSPGPGRPYRLLLGCYPTPARTDTDPDGPDAGSEENRP